MLLHLSELRFLYLQDWWDLFLPGMSEILKRYIGDSVEASLERLPAHSRGGKSQSAEFRHGTDGVSWLQALVPGLQNRQNLGPEMEGLPIG